MKLIKVKNYKEMSKKAADIIIKDINKKPNLILGLTTGKTPLGMYKRLVKANKKNRVDFSRVKVFNLDEYYPIKKNNKKSFYYYLVKNFLSKINIKKKNVNLLNGEVKDYRKQCEDYEKNIKKNKIDILILGMGVNGHIAFNEPGSSFKSKTRLVNLASVTIKRNSSLLRGKIPDKALTIGIGTILSAKKIILLANGKHKSEAIKHLIKGRVDKSWPVTALKNHKNFIVIVDKEVLK